MERPDVYKDLTCQQIFEISYPEPSRGRAEFAQFVATQATERVIPLEVWRTYANPPTEAPQGVAKDGFCMACMSTIPPANLARLYALVHPEAVSGENSHSLEALSMSLIRALAAGDE